MSIRIMARVWDSGPQDKSDLLVLLALADSANGTGLARADLRRLAHKARMDERDVMTILERLEASGWITHRDDGWQILGGGA